MGYSWVTETFKKNWVRCVFFKENGQLVFRTCQYDADHTFKLEKKLRYCVVQKFIHYDKHIPYLFYQDDNPNPIEFERVKNMFLGRSITSEVFNEAMESKVIKELVSLGAVESLIMILLCILILIGLLNLAAAAGVFDPKIVNATLNATINSTVIR